MARHYCVFWLALLQAGQLRCLLLLLLYSVCLAPPHKGRELFYMPRLAFVESSNNPNAINRKTGAIGKYQILPCKNGAMAHYNEFSLSGIKYTRRDLFDPYINELIASWDIRVSKRFFYSHGYRGIELDILAVHAHNAGRNGTLDAIRERRLFTNYLVNVFGELTITNFLNKL